jgi:DNA-binding MarR family transcriptional regulator
MSEPNLFESIAGETPEEEHNLRLWFTLLGCFTQVERALRRRLRQDFDTSLPRFDVLTALVTFSDGLTMSELAQKLGVSKGNVTGVVRRLWQDGLVRQIRQKTDRRVQRVVLTEQGSAHWTEMRLVYRAVVDAVLAELPSEQADALSARLHDMQILIDRSEPVPTP